MKIKMENVVLFHSDLAKRSYTFGIQVRIELLLIDIKARREAH